METTALGQMFVSASAMIPARNINGGVLEWRQRWGDTKLWQPFAMALDQRQRLRWTCMSRIGVYVDHFATRAFLGLQKVCKHDSAVLADDGELEPLFFLKRRNSLLKYKFVQ
jgi:hypothetical protein